MKPWTDAVIGSFTTRDVAIAFWTTVLLIWALRKPDIRRNLGAALKVAATLWRRFLALLLYVGLAIWACWSIGLWTPELLKDSALWFVLSGGALAFSQMQIHTEPGTWSARIKEQIGIVVVVEYVVNTYTFSLPVELVLVPGLGLVAMLDVFARHDPRHASVAKLPGCVQSTLVLGVGVSAIWTAVSHAPEFGSAATFRAIAIIPTLSALLVPFIYTVAIFTAYEQLWSHISTQADRNRKVVRYARCRLLKHLGLSPGRIRRFFRDGRVIELRRIRTREDVDALLEHDASELDPRSDGEA